MEALAERRTVWLRLLLRGIFLRARARERRRWGKAAAAAEGSGGNECTIVIHEFATNRSISLGNHLICPQESARVHDDPERRALAQPRDDVAARAGGARTSGLAHHAGAHDESHVRYEVVRCVARAREETRRVNNMLETPQEQTAHATPEALAARTRIHARDAHGVPKRQRHSEPRYQTSPAARPDHTTARATRR